MLKLLKTRQCLLSLTRPLIAVPRINPSSNQARRFAHDDSAKGSDSSTTKSNITSVTSKFEIFRDEDSPMILDIEEERQKLDAMIETEESIPDAFAGLNLVRGKRGVFDIEDLVQVLQRDNAQDIFVCKVPKELRYVDYMCVIHGRSLKHMRAIAEFVRKMHKMKKAESDAFVKIEGAGSQDWIAIDLGNIALHIFSQKARDQFDIESLWSIGSQYDRESNKKTADDIIDLYERHSKYLDDLTAYQRPLGDSETPFDEPVDEHGNPLEPDDLLKFPSETKSSDK